MNQPSEAQTQFVKDLFQVIQQWLAARATEHNTHIGAIGGVIAQQPITDALSQATIAALAHDYPTALAKCSIALIGILGVLGAIITPQGKPGTLGIATLTGEISALKRQD